MQTYSTQRGARWFVFGCAVVCLFLTAMVAQAQVASALLQEDGALPGAPGETIDSLSNTAVNHVGGFAVTTNTSGSGTTLSHVWGSATPGAGTVLRTESTIGDFTQGSFESFFGLANDGTICYGTTDTNNVTMEAGLDSVYLSGSPLLREGDMIVSVSNELSTFNSRPGISGNGIPYWAGGFTSGGMGGTANRALFAGDPPAPLLMGGDSVGGVVEPVDMGSLDFDFRLTELGGRYIIATNMDAPSTTDGVLIISGNAVEIDGMVVREGSPVAPAAGGLAGENWDNFDFLGINEAGTYFVTGDTDAATAADEFVLMNDMIILREGTILPEGTVSGAIEGGYMNANGDWAVIWDIETPGGNIEALIYNGDVLLTETQAVDWNNDGVIDAGDNNGVIDNFTGISSLTVGAPLPNGDVDIYFTADIDFNGTSTTTDDLEGYFRVTVSASTACDLPGDLNDDGVVDGKDIQTYVDCITNPTMAGCECADMTFDGIADNNDTFLFVAALLENDSRYTASLGSVNGTITTDAGAQPAIMDAQLKLSAGSPDANGIRAININEFLIGTASVSTLGGNTGGISFLYRPGTGVGIWNTQTGQFSFGAEMDGAYPLADQAIPDPPLSDDDADTFDTDRELWQVLVNGTATQVQGQQVVEIDGDVTLTVLNSITGRVSAVDINVENVELKVVEDDGTGCPKSRQCKKRSLCLQPVFVRDDNGMNASGSSFAVFQAAANDVWARCCVEFEWQAPVFVDSTAFQVIENMDQNAGLMELSMLGNEVDEDGENDCIEIFFVEEMNKANGDAHASGDGICASGGAKHSKVWVSDAAVDDCDPDASRVCAHEIGHVMGLQHESGCVMTPGGNPPNCPENNPDMVSLEQCKSLRNPLLKEKAPEEDCCKEPNCEVGGS